MTDIDVAFDSQSTPMRLWRTARAYLAIYRAQFKTTVAIQLQYRVSLALWMAYTILEPIIYLTVWSTVARASGGTVGGFSPDDFAAYFIVTRIVNHLTFTWVMFEFEYRIRQGQFSPKLLRPVHPIHGDIADNLTYKVLTAVVIVPAVIVMSLLFTPDYNFTMNGTMLALPALFLAFIMRFLMGWTLALAAFWTTRVGAVNLLYFSFFVFLSGAMVPLSLLPETFQTASWFLPFRWGIAFPSELFLGQVPPDQVLPGYALQIFWLIACYVVFRLVWQRALRTYTSVGA